jgi:crossover junction endodeoxyribonuclease RuvC
MKFCMSMISLILGLDPGLRHTGWGIVAQENNRLSFVAAGCINPDPDLPMAARLYELAEDLTAVLNQHHPDEAAIEETFMNKNAASALKLGQARGAAMLALAQGGLTVTEYAANRIKQSLTGYGHADKTQIQAMIGMLLPGSGKLAADAADALAAAICHAHHRDSLISRQSATIGR